MAEVEGKKLTELRVIDLKTELERRGLDKTGNKAALLDRLSKAIREEGNDPDEILIVPGGGHSKIPPTPKKPVELPVVVEEPPVERTEPEIHKESTNDIDSFNKKDNKVIDHNESSNTSNLEEPEISINARPEDLDMEGVHESEHEDDQQHEPQSEFKEQHELEPEMEQEAEQEMEHEETLAYKNEESDKKDYFHSEENSNISAIEANGIDNEDSINLTIGEDEQLESLLADELEPTTKQKDGGAKKKTEESQNDKKGDSKGSGRADIAAGSSDKEGATSSSTSAAASNKDTDGTKSSDASGKGSKKDDKDKGTASTTASRNLWVSGLSSTTRATDLKSIFSKYGKVIGAKVVTNAKTPGARCYGYVTMSTSDDAEKCIQHLHRTELHGRVISVEKAKGDAQSHNRKREPTAKVDKPEDKEKSKESESKDKDSEKNQAEKKDDDSLHDAVDKSADDSNDRDKRETSENKDEGSLKDCDTRSNKSSGRRSDRERGRSEDKKRSWDRKASRSKSRDRNRSRDNVLSFAKIKEERERQRVREKERVVREEKRRRREDVERQRAIEREAARLEREREKLRMERERIEQEKAELLRLERERQKVEREKLERERLELKRLQMRQEETRRGGGGGGGGAPPPVPAGIKRPTGERREGRDAYEPERKRIATEHSSSRRHSPPPSRFDSRSKDIPVQKSFKPRPDFGSSRNSRDDYSDPRGGRDVVVRREGRPNHNEIDHRPPKERYERPSNFQRDREVHRPDDTHRSSRDTHNRYENSKPNPRDNRYVENRPTGWHSGPPSKPYNPTHNRNEQTGWNSRSSDTRPSNPRWNNSNNMGNNMGGHPRSQVYQGGPQYGMSQGNSSGPYERYDSYKGSMQNMRKY
ncbi:SAFB-like transcription modulator isoform X2 [Phymastichus coffea]|uniref:SAFB-like transcription modulator isoform X2 n=1 Tax=Phymastichus coffea TaxID=108790 RepID=UPI00273AB3EC|nr:SAFB-like transcription modulator isoform X2 [Phymastichus coffea]